MKKVTKRLEVAFLEKSKNNAEMTKDGYSLSICLLEYPYNDLMKEWFGVNLTNHSSDDIITYAEIRGYSVEISKNSICFYKGGGKQKTTEKKIQQDVFDALNENRVMVLFSNDQELKPKKEVIEISKLLNHIKELLKDSNFDLTCYAGGYINVVSKDKKRFDFSRWKEFLKLMGETAMGYHSPLELIVELDGTVHNEGCPYYEITDYKIGKKTYSLLLGLVGFK